jgi:hypothetical protein
MIKMLATAFHISNGSIVHNLLWFHDAMAAEMAAEEAVSEMKLLEGIVDYTVIIQDCTQRDKTGTEILHLCMDDAQPYYEHRMGWRDNYDVARHVAARRRHLLDKS